MQLELRPADVNMVKPEAIGSGCTFYSDRSSTTILMYKQTQNKISPPNPQTTYEIASVWHTPWSALNQFASFCLPWVLNLIPKW